jgi:hypothetical protein
MSGQQEKQMSQGNTRHRPSSRSAPPPAQRGRPGVSTLIVLFLAFFALTLAILLRTLLADQILVAPANQYARAELQAANATYFDASIVAARSGVTMTLTSTVRGNVKDSKAAKGDTVVWDTFLALEDLQNGNKVEISEERIAFDRKTAEMVDCCKATGKPTPGEPTYGLFFPVGIEKKTYNVYDFSSNKAWPMRFDGTEKRGGMEVYRFVQRIDETNRGQYERPLPSNLLGLPGKSRDVPVDSYFGGTMTAWIEPRSGVLVDRRQQVTSSLKTKDGQGRLLVADLDLRMSEKTQKDLRDKAETAASAKTLLKTTGPAVSVVVSVLLFALGAFLLIRRRRTQALANEPF